MRSDKTLCILGIRGVPAQHGGFETFAEHLSLYLVAKGWDVIVYCQEDGYAGPAREDVWRGVRRVNIPVSKAGALGTIQFDWRSIRHVLASGHRMVLTLGYNTASFCLPFRLRGIRNLINMDGIEWRREKWRPHERAWLWLNERCGCWLGDHLVADHPEIANHLAMLVSRDKIATIPYGATEVTSSDSGRLDAFGLAPGLFATVIARPEPENSVLEIVRAFSRKRRGIKLVMLGHYQPELNPFHKAVLAAASSEVIFPGAIYDQAIVQALRFFCCLYLHGHRVGGTNPSLVEALGAGNAVIAHDNCFNRWVAGPEAAYFADEEECARLFDRLLQDYDALEAMRIASRKRFIERFTWEQVLTEYENLLLKWYPTN